MNQIVNSRLLTTTLWSIILFLFGYLLAIAQGLLVPFVLALFLWYLVNMLADLVGRLRIAGRAPPRALQFALSGLALVVAVNIVVNIVASSVNELIGAAPQYQQNLRRIIQGLQARVDFVEIPAAAQLAAEMNFAGFIRGVASGFGNLVGNAGLIAVYLLFLFLEQRYFYSKLMAVLPDAARQRRVEALLAQIGHDVRIYIGIKTLVSLLTSLAAWAIMVWVDLDFAAFWALLIFVLNFIPNIGSIVATLLPSLLALVQYDTFGPFLVVALGVGVVQIVVGNFIEPSLMGKSLNMSPLVIIMSLVIWGSLWGLPGMFLCVPITVVAMIVSYNFESTRWVALLLSQDGQLKPALRAEPGEFMVTPGPDER